MMQLMVLGLVFIAVGMLLMIWPRKGPGSEERMKEPDECEECRTKGGAIIMIGPLPIVIGSDPRTTMVLMLIALLIMLIWALALIRR